MIDPHEFYPMPDADRIQELLAGHVLGNLDPDEVQQLHQILQTSPELTLETQELRETLELLPYALPIVPPPDTLRSQLLQTVDSPPRRQRLFRFPRLVGATAVLALLAVAWGADRHRLHHQVASLQTELDQIALEDQEMTVPLSQMLLPAEVILANRWDGLDQLVSDHLRSVTQEQGPVDVPSAQAAELTQILKQQISLPEGLPLVLEQKSRLLGGSPCQLGGTEGARFSYRYSQDVILSFYVLARQERSQFPRTGSRTLYIQGPQQPGILLWEDDSYIYSLVAPLPVETLRDLAARVREI